MRDGRYIVLLSVERCGSEHKILRVKYNDWHVSCDSFSNPNRVNIPTFPMYDDIMSYNSRFARLVWQ